MLTVINPATGRIIERLPTDGARSIAARFRAAHAAQPAWADLPLRRRLDSIRRFRAAVVAETAELAAILTGEVGKPITQARAELEGLLERLDFFLDAAPRVLRERRVHRDTTRGLRENITAEPLGVIANISAWNYPYYVGSNVFIPALLAGNAVLYKPSEYASRTGLAIARLLHAAGVPADVFATVIGSGETGSTLLRQEVDGVFFTGSYQTGRRIARAAGRRMIKVQLELGGKDPVYVCEDAPVDPAAASLAEGAFYNAGQSCCAVERLYVHAAIFDRFLAAFLRRVMALRVGDPMDERTTLGPLTRPAQVDVLEAQVADARARGARVLLGGRRLRRAGNFFAPTILVDVTHEMAVMREESFGPIVGLMRVRDDAEAVALMNDTEYGLTAGVYSRDEHRARRILARTHAGSAYWNCCDRVSPRLPWSGTKHSGLGLTLSEEGILAFTRPKAWHLRRKA